MSKFTDRLNRAMSIRNMRSIDLVNATGLSKPRISQYVNGVYDAKQDALYKIANALDVNISWLMGHDVPMGSFDENQKELLSKINNKYGEDCVELLKIFTELNTKKKKEILTFAYNLINEEQN